RVGRGAPHLPHHAPALDDPPGRPDRRAPGGARRRERQPRRAARAGERPLPRARRARDGRPRAGARGDRRRGVRERLEERGELGHAETLRILARAARYLGPFRRRFAVKFGLLLLSLVPLLALPWPVKILVDHVILHVPVDAPTTPYPAPLRPL